MESGGGGLSGDVNTDCSEAVVCSRPEVDAQPLAEHEESAETKFVAPAVLFACRAALLRGSTTSRAAFEKYSSAVDPALAKALEVVGSYNCEVDLFTYNHYINVPLQYFSLSSCSPKVIVLVCV